MTNSERLKILIDSSRTVFTPQDLRLLWQEKAFNVRINASRMVKKRLITRLAKGYYVINEKYNTYELANRIISPSYVSFQAALTFAGLSFQARDEIGSVAMLNYRKKVGGILYTYFAMKNSLFFIMNGIVTRDGFSIALPERAVLDSLYFGFLPDLDDADKLNKKYLLNLSAIYPKTVQKKIRGLL
jgi:predicted transcriptional regulator of viral defense system